MLSIIEAKKNKAPLDETQIQFWVDGVVNESIPLYQSASLLMAIRLNGMTFEESWLLTKAMTASGDRLHYDQHPIVVDKHSTGGVGDKVTLVLAPLVAACGVPVAMLSGRALGFTGGTIDKLESLDGVQCELPEPTLMKMMDEVGWVNAQPSSRIAPADRALYALRDVTGTVDSIPLITASIMSKKLAGGATHLCLDVKCGSSAFMKTESSASELAHALCRVGELGGVKVGGVISRMSEPLGFAIGNYLELWEAVQYLKSWPQSPLASLIEALAIRMLLMYDPSISDPRAQLMNAIDRGAALESLKRYLAFCGGKKTAVQHLVEDDLGWGNARPVLAPKDGYVDTIDGHGLALDALALGAGRMTKEDRIDPMAGFMLRVGIGDRVEKGDPLMHVFGDRAGDADPLLLGRHFGIIPQARPATSLILASVDP
ncbi:MAG: thymidine phosphorylase [Acidobacteria bacterium]|nr:thymidine phosphorylase [Acidobacteriota bacterium]